MDLVTDFSAGDILEFSTSTFSSFSDVQATMDQVGNNAVINLDGARA